MPPLPSCFSMRKWASALPTRLGAVVVPGGRAPAWVSRGAAAPASALATAGVGPVGSTSMHDMAGSVAGLVPSSHGDEAVQLAEELGEQGPVGPRRARAELRQRGARSRQGCA